MTSTSPASAQLFHSLPGFAGFPTARHGGRGAEPPGSDCPAVDGPGRLLPATSKTNTREQQRSTKLAPPAEVCEGVETTT